MNLIKPTLLSSAIAIALLNAPTVAAQSHHSSSPSIDSAKTQILEQRIKELENRLERLDALTQQQPQTSQSPTSPQADVKKLTNEVHLLERKLEVQEEVADANAKKAPIIEAGEKGFKMTSADKKNQVRLRGAVQVDNHTFTGESHLSADGKPLTIDSFDLKQGRVWLEGYVFNDVAFKIMPDFAASGNVLPDAYIDYTYHPSASLLVGKFKPALSLERLQGDSDGTFVERAFPTYLASNRDVGVQLHGGFNFTGHGAEKVAGPIDTKNQLTYQVGVFNGAGDDGSPNNNAPDTNDNKEFVGRIFAQPFQHSGYSWIEGLGLGVAGSYAQPTTQTLKNQATPIGRNTYLSYASLNTGFTAPTANGDTYRIYPQAYWYAGGFGLMGEYAVSSQNLLSTQTVGKIKTNRTINQTNSAWQVLGSYVLTGEDNSFGAIRPIQAFNPLEGKWGALQLAGRYSQLDVDSDTFLFVDPNKSANQARAWTVGANWYLNANALIRADYEQVSFDGGASKGGNRPTEQVFATRFQLAF